MNETLKNAIQALVNSADNTGCTDDLTVVSKAALDKIESLMKEQDDNRRRYFKTEIQVTVLSEGEPVPGGMDLEDIASEIDTGDWVGDIKITKVTELTGKQAADALYAARSDPSFFQLNDDGRHEDDEDDEDEGE